MKIALFALILLQVSLLNAQDLSPELRKKFVADQEVYFKNLRLSENQKLQYQEITRRYDKQLLFIEQSEQSKGIIKKKQKLVKKAKNTEMKAVLDSKQYKLYLIRQKEIEQDYY